MVCTTRSRTAGATREPRAWCWTSARVFDDTTGGGGSDSSSGSGGSTCSQLLSASASASAEVSSVTLTHVTPVSVGVSVPLLSLASSLVLDSSPVAEEDSEASEASAATGAAFSSFTGSTTESSVLAFSFSASASASAALLSSSSLSFSSFSSSRSFASRSFLSLSRSCRSVITQDAAPSAAASGRDLFFSRSAQIGHICQQTSQSRHAPQKAGVVK